MVLNFYLDNLNIPDDVREFDHVDIYFQKDFIQFECSYDGDIVPSRVFKVHLGSTWLKGVSFDG